MTEKNISFFLTEINSSLCDSAIFCCFNINLNGLKITMCIRDINNYEIKEME